MLAQYYASTRPDERGVGLTEVLPPRPGLSMARTYELLFVILNTYTPDLHGGVTYIGQDGEQKQAPKS